jgi:hypothetical protein
MTGLDDSGMITLNTSDFERVSAGGPLALRAAAERKNSEESIPDSWDSDDFGNDLEEESASKSEKKETGSVFDLFPEHLSASIAETKRSHDILFSSLSHQAKDFVPSVRINENVKMSVDVLAAVISHYPELYEKLQRPQQTRNVHSINQELSRNLKTIDSMISRVNSKSGWVRTSVAFNVLLLICILYLVACFVLSREFVDSCGYGGYYMIH